MNKISVITVTYNSARTIKDCLDSLISFCPSAEIIVVDNGSSDNTLDLVKKFDKQVKLIEVGSNMGFAKANNLGVKEASGEYLVFLNPDAFLTKKGDLEYLKEILEANPNYALLGPKLIYPDNSYQPKVRNLPTVWRAFEEYVLGFQGRYSFYQPRCSGLCEVESVNGACLMVKKDLFNQIGRFDEKYFMYYEELDLCRRVYKLGYKIGFVPEIIVMHAEGISASQNKKVKRIMSDSAKKYFGLFTYFLLNLVFFYNRLINRIRKMTGHSVHV